MKILVIKRDKIGDLLLTTPLFALLKASLPQVETHLLANDYNAWVAAGNPHLDRVWVYRRVRNAGRVSLDAAWQWLWQSLALRRERYDWVIVANGDESPRAIRRGLSLGGARSVARCADASKYPRLSDPLPPDGSSHEIERLMGLLFPLGLKNPDKKTYPSYTLPDASAAFTRSWLAGRGLAPGKYVVIGLGARRPKRSDSGCLNNFTRFISGFRAGCTVQSCPRRRASLATSDRRGGQLGTHHGIHLARPAPTSAG